MNRIIIIVLDQYVNEQRRGGVTFAKNNLFPSLTNGY